MKTLAHVIDERADPHVDVLLVKRVLQHPHDIVANRILGIEAFCPCQQFARINSRLFDRETAGRQPHDLKQAAGLT